MTKQQLDNDTYVKLHNTDQQQYEHLRLSPPILRRTSTIKIGIVIIVGDGADLEEFRYPIESVHCYAETHHYGFELIQENSEWLKKCNQKDVGVNEK